jgi:hypothetical protein
LRLPSTTGFAKSRKTKEPRKQMSKYSKCRPPVNETKHALLKKLFDVTDMEGVFSAAEALLKKPQLRLVVSND